LLRKLFKGGNYIRKYGTYNLISGEEELREETDADRMMAVQMKVKKNPFFKTIMCKSLAECQYGENCVYAHSQSEVRPMQASGFTAGPGSFGMMAGMGVPGGVQKSGYKSSLCKNFMEGGECSYGPKCNFAHGPMEIRSVASQPMMPAGTQGGSPGGMNPMFKTSMCHNMMNEGNCMKGMMCKFAHSPTELRGQGGYSAGPQGGSTPMGTPNVMIQGSDGKIKYKTSMCTVFMEQGFCPRGEACGFAHSAKQLLEVQLNEYQRQIYHFFKFSKEIP
jgi:hypothetical protein